MNLCARLDRLERIDNAARTIVVWQDHRETEQEAIARWRSARPGEPQPDLGKVLLIGWEAKNP